MKPRLFVGQPTVSSRLTKITTTKAGSCCFAYRFLQGSCFSKLTDSQSVNQSPSTRGSAPSLDANEDIIAEALASFRLLFRLRPSYSPPDQRVSYPPQLEVDREERENDTEAHLPEQHILLKMPSKKCEHNRRKSQCKECLGSIICPPH